ncbi:Protein phosphatase 2C family [Phytophthora cactorum]|nr:Protein phosphatase 2C family [Phytophthora cactorum]
MPKLELFSYWQSSCSWRARIALAWKGIQYEYHPVDLRAAGGGEQQLSKFRKLNPNQVRRLRPVMLVDGHAIAQSGAILEYLEEAYPARPLLPSDLFERAKCVTCPASLAATPSRPRALSPASDKERQALVAAWNKHWIERGLRAVEDELTLCAGRYCVGDEVSLADVYLLPQVHNARICNVSWPSIQRSRVWWASSSSCRRSRVLAPTSSQTPRRPKWQIPGVLVAASSAPRNSPRPSARISSGAGWRASCAAPRLYRGHRTAQPRARAEYTWRLGLRDHLAADVSPDRGGYRCRGPGDRLQCAQAELLRRVHAQRRQTGQRRPFPRHRQPGSIWPWPVGGGAALDVSFFGDLLKGRVLENYVVEGRAPALKIRNLLKHGRASEDTQFFGVYDGHGGARASSLLALLFPVYILAAPEYKSDLATACHSASMAINDEILKREKDGHCEGGATAVTLLIRGNTFVLSNTGDCRAIMVAKRDKVAQVTQLTTDHKASNDQEKQRIEEHGGLVLYVKGVARVNGRLAVARAFGDAELSQLVIADPEVTVHELHREDEYIVMASDGLWDVLTNEQVASCIRNNPWLNVQEMASMLADRAVELGTMDNVTVVVVDVRGRIS